MEKIKGFLHQPITTFGTMQVEIWHVLVALVGLYMLSRKR